MALAVTVTVLELVRLPVPFMLEKTRRASRYIADTKSKFLFYLNTVLPPKILIYVSLKETDCYVIEEFSLELGVVVKRNFNQSLHGKL